MQSTSGNKDRKFIVDCFQKIYCFKKLFSSLCWFGQEKKLLFFQYVSNYKASLFLNGKRGNIKDIDVKFGLEKKREFHASRNVKGHHT